MNSDTPNTLQNASDLVQAGIAAAKAGQREQARKLLTQAVDQDESNAVAWLWLSGVVDSNDDREVCLENVLTLDPGNEAARRGLEWIQWQKETQPPPPAVLTHEPEPPSTKAIPERVAAVGVAPVEAEEPVSAHKPELGPVSNAGRTLYTAEGWDGYPDEYRCPYCAAQTLTADRKCQACGGSLMLKKRRLEERSNTLWILILLQFASTVYTAALPAGALVYAAIRIRYREPLQLFDVYLGLPSSVPPAIASAALAIVPRPVFFLLAIPCLLSLALLIGLYLRWRPIFYLFALNCFLEFAFAMVSWSLAQGAGLIAGGVSVGSALLGFFLLFRIEDDFYLEERRITLLLDRDALHSSALLNRARVYAGRKMWAMAAIHYRRACGMLPEQLDCRLALAAAFVKLRQYELAANTLAQARTISPSDPRVEELATLLEQSRIAPD